MDMMVKMNVKVSVSVSVSAPCMTAYARSHLSELEPSHLRGWLPSSVMIETVSTLTGWLGTFKSK